MQSVIPDHPVVTEECQSDNSYGREMYNIPPGRNKHPVSLTTDKLCDELAFPVLFPNERFGYTAEREINYYQWNTWMPDCYISAEDL